MDTDLALLLSQASHALTTEVTAALASLGITPRIYCVLRAALAADRTQSQLASLCGLDKTTMVATIDELERAGLAERRPSTSDRRARIIAVTGAGERALAAAVEIVDGVYADVLAALPAGERAALVRALERLMGEGGRLAADRLPGSGPGRLPAV